MDEGRLNKQDEELHYLRVANERLVEVERTLEDKVRRFGDLALDMERYLDRLLLSCKIPADDVLMACLLRSRAKILCGR